MDTGLDSLKIASKRLVHKTGGYLEIKIADRIDKLNADKIVKQELLSLEVSSCGEVKNTSGN